MPLLASNQGAYKRKHTNGHQEDESCFKVASMSSIACQRGCSSQEGFLSLGFVSRDDLPVCMEAILLLLCRNPRVLCISACLRPWGLD